MSEVSIKQLADEIGVTKTAVSKKIDKLGLRSRLTQVKNQWFIPESVQKQLIESFSGYKPNKNNPSTVDTLIFTLQDQVKDLQTQVQTLTNQLNIKDEQIRDLQRDKDQLKLLNNNKPLAIEQKDPEQKKGFFDRFRRRN